MVSRNTKAMVRVHIMKHSNSMAPQLFTGVLFCTLRVHVISGINLSGRLKQGVSKRGSRGDSSATQRRLLECSSRGPQQKFSLWRNIGRSSHWLGIRSVQFVREQAHT